MRSATGRWVSGEDFFDRERELEVLTTRVREQNHVLLTGQRRMGKTSILRELGSRLESEGWIFFIADVEGATCPGDAISEIARAAHPVRSIASRGYLESSGEGYRFPSRLLRDWWLARFRGHYVPLERRRTNDDSGELAP